ncbi:hypothetical protein [Psychroflexus halocasei]|uniref:Uncharacterized protein n=1 Tax=Psychroflexus halocasei TaxID=908615 RepID=A0A1H4DF66_9FLAO|nr:hypothetical protein [Psychroflexus halocasei]SEA71395.1 hypothetical protein SAMN05421540_11115 [Psychroflexus halocasei]
MKKISKLFFFVVISSFVLSCTVEDDDVPPIIEKQNSLKVGSMETELISGFLQTDEPQNDVYAYGIILYDTEVNYVNGQPVPENNTSNGIALEIYSDNPQMPAVGDYVFNDSAIVDANVLSNANLILGLDYEVQTATKIVEIEYGVLKISDNGTAYELSFDGIDEEDNQVSIIKGL